MGKVRKPLYDDEPLTGYCCNLLEAVVYLQLCLSWWRGECEDWFEEYAPAPTPTPPAPTPPAPTPPAPTPPAPTPPAPTPPAPTPPAPTPPAPTPPAPTPTPTPTPTPIYVYQCPYDPVDTSQDHECYRGILIAKYPHPVFGLPYWLFFEHFPANYVFTKYCGIMGTAKLDDVKLGIDGMIDLGYNFTGREKQC